MTDLTEADIQQGIAPRSDQVNADDLIVGPITVTITGARLVDDDKQPWLIDLAEFKMKGTEKPRPYKPCLTMRRLMKLAMGKNPRLWIGQQMTLYRDPQVQYMADTVGGIRISHFSALKETETFNLTDKRGKKMAWVVCPLTAPKQAEPTEKDRLYIDEITKMIAAVSTPEELANLGGMLTDKSAPIKEALKGPYRAKKAELEQPPPEQE